MIFADSDVTVPAAHFFLRGLIGLPIVKALGRVRLHRDGRIEVRRVTPGAEGPPADRIPVANLAFDGLTPIINGAYGDRGILVCLDTGSRITDLLPPFIRDFPSDVQRRGRDTILDVNDGPDLVESAGTMSVASTSGSPAG